MTIESARAYLERTKSDESFRKACSDKSSPEEWMKHVRENGFDFSNDDMEQVKSELSDDELKAIGGGIYIKISDDDRTNIPE